MGDHSGRSNETLRAFARQQIKQGALPRRKAARTWGGLGSGAACSLCGAPISTSEPEFELQFDVPPAPAVLRFHRQCHLAWDSALHELSAAQWLSIAQSLPPANVPIEARIELNARRSIILGVMYAEQRDTGELEWVNLTTRAPLPPGWRPVEWRYAPGTPQTAAPEAERSIPKSA